MKTFNIEGKILDLSTVKIMGILNITTDSFFDGGKYLSKNKILESKTEMKGKKIMKMYSLVSIRLQSVNFFN